MTYKGVYPCVGYTTPLTHLVCRCISDAYRLMKILKSELSVFSHSIYSSEQTFSECSLAAVSLTCDTLCLCLSHAYVESPRRHQTQHIMRTHLSIHPGYGVSAMSSLLQIIGLLCKRALYKRLSCAKEPYTRAYSLQIRHIHDSQATSNTAIMHAILSVPCMGSTTPLTHILYVTLSLPCVNVSLSLTRALESLRRSLSLSVSQ